MATTLVVLALFFGAPILIGCIIGIGSEGDELDELRPPSEAQGDRDAGVRVR